MTGPLDGVRVVEIASAAPAPFACMVLADLGAEVLRVDRAPKRPSSSPPVDPLSRGRRSVVVNLKTEAGAQVVRTLVGRADVLVEGFRPGVMERIGLGPKDLHEVNPALVYGRMTGWGQDGPLAARAGHDINYIAAAGALHPLGRAGERPHAPINLLGDFGGGGMLLAVGILAALLERTTSGRGQVVDAAMVDGAALLTSFLYGVRAQGHWVDERGTNLLDGGAPFYDTYETADGKFVAVGALEKRFYARLLEGLGLAEDTELPAQMDRGRWPELRARFEAVFKSRTRDEWDVTFSEVDACVCAVLSPDEVANATHSTERRAFVDVGGVTQPAPAPRFDRTPAVAVPSAPPVVGADTESALLEWGLTREDVDQLLRDGAIESALSSRGRTA